MALPAAVGTELYSHKLSMETGPNASLGLACASLPAENQCVLRRNKSAARLE